MLGKVQRYYETLIEEKSHWLFFWVVLVLVLLGIQARHFTLDASAESLLLENDQSLEYFREVSDRYGSQEFLVLTFTPKQPLFSEEALSTLTALRNELRTIKRVESVVTVMDVPLLSNPPVPMSELVSNIKTLEDPAADIAMARSELANSPLYVNLLLNLDENTTALQINFPIDETKADLLDMRRELRKQAELQPESGADVQLKLVEQLIFEHNSETAALLHQDIEQIREIMGRYQSHGELHLGGVPMIADDIIQFVRSDLLIFGTAVFLLIIVTLAVIFRQIRWVVLPLFCSSAVVVAMLGVLGWWQWPVTVISSNFISLLLILTLSMNIHLVVRYRELLRQHPYWDQRELVVTTIRRIAIPCVYMTLTTGVAFVSLIASGIRPVINFGWMMTVGICVAFTMTFVLFPAMLMLLGKDRRTGEERQGGPLTKMMAKFTLRNGQLILLASLAIAAFTVLGASRLIVENSFIDYFDEKTEIYQGMTVIDQRLGGTTPLEVILHFGDGLEEFVNEGESSLSDLSDGVKDDANSDEFVDDFNDDFSDDFSDEFVTEDFLAMEEGGIGSFEDDFVGEDDPDKYWFTTDKVEEIKRLHRYLDGLPETGKVISLATMIEIAEEFNDGQPLTNIQLALLYSVIPQEFRAIVVDPYVSVANNEARVSVRILDSMQGLQRDALLKRMQSDFENNLGFAPERVQLTGMMVLYNNMLQSLFSSQILTLSAVFVAYY